MKKILRYVFLLIVCIVVVSGYTRDAFASDPIEDYWKFTSGSTHYSSARAACATLPLYSDSTVTNIGWFPDYFGVAEANAASAECVAFDGQVRARGGGFVSRIIVCASGESQSGVSCVPPSGACSAGSVSDVWISAGSLIAGTGRTTDMAAPMNIQGCAVNSELLHCMIRVNEPSKVDCQWRATQTGVSVGGTDTGVNPLGGAPSPATPMPAVPPFSPATGQGCPAGTVNMGTDSSGLSICGGSGTTPDPRPDPAVTTKPPVTTTNEDGSTTKVEVTERANADGSKTTVTKTTVTQSNGTSTTTETESTGARPDGLSGKKDDTKEEEKSDLCKQHPELNICQNSQVSGACETLACTGDAITCAIARQTAEQNCRGKKLEDDAKASPQWALGNQALNGSDPLAANFPNNPAKGIPVAMPTNMDSSGWLGGGACFPDKPFTFQGQQFVIPFNTVCQNMTGFRYAVMIVALLMSFRMLAGAIFKE
jgi:hypothetical protein